MTTVSDQTIWSRFKTRRFLIARSETTMNEQKHQNLTSAPTPGFFVASWGSLEECLTLLAGTPERGALVPEAVSALRKTQVSGEPPSKTLLRVLAATAFLTDDRPLGGSTGGPMGGIGAMS